MPFFLCTFEARHFWIISIDVHLNFATLTFFYEPWLELAVAFCLTEAGRLSAGLLFPTPLAPHPRLFSLKLDPTWKNAVLAL